MSHHSPITSHKSLAVALRDGDIAQLEREHVPSAALAAELTPDAHARAKQSMALRESGTGTRRRRCASNIFP